MIDLSIQKSLGANNGEMVLEVKLQINKGDFVSLYGRSGAGKTSLLRILAGLMPVDNGYIKVDEQVWLNKEEKINLPPQERQVGMVFQDYALFPNMTVRDNLLFGLGKGQSKQVIEELIEIVELGELQHRKPQTLSGGQQQRVALARALVQKPKILMLDEPLSALDNEIRTKLQQYILQVHKEYDLTTLLISHDVSEILKMSDMMLVIDNGKITKSGSPEQVFVNKEVSGKFQFTGEVIGIQKQDFLFIVTILIGKDLVKVIADESEIRTITIGDKVLVASKAFNPIIKKLQ